MAAFGTQMGYLSLLQTIGAFAGTAARAVGLAITWCAAAMASFLGAATKEPRNTAGARAPDLTLKRDWPGICCVLCIGRGGISLLLYLFGLLPFSQP